MLKRLIKIRLLSLLGSSFSKDKQGRIKKRSILGAGIAYLILGICFVMLSVTYSSILAPVAVLEDAGWVFFALFNAVTFSIIFMTSIFETKSMLFECKDNELLLSMPIRSLDIVISRILSVLIVNYLTAAVALVPATVIYYTLSRDALSLIGGFLMLVFIPVFATSLSAGVGYIVSVISRKFKNSNLATVISSLLFFVVFFILYGGMMSGMEELEEDPAGILSSLTLKLAALRPLGEASLLKPVPVLIISLVSVLISALVFYIITKNYVHIITRSVKAIRTKYVHKSLRRDSAFGALAKKELARFFSSSAYILNAGMGAIMQIAFGVLAVANMSTLGEADAVLGAEFGNIRFLPVVLSVVLIAVLSTSEASASALSLEGKNLWILASMPIRTEAIIFAKLVPHLLIGGISTVISAVLLAVTVGASPIEAVLMLLIPLSGLLMYALFGLVMNIALPKFDYQNEAQVIKQSGAVTIVTLAGMLFNILLLGVSFLLVFLVGEMGAFILILVLLLILSCVFFLVLTGPSKRKLEMILKENC